MKTVTTSNLITFTFDGDLQPIVFNAADAERHAQRAAMHGFEQKIRDNAAISRKQKDGTVITVTEAMRREAVAEMVTHLTTSSDWNTRGIGRAQNPIWLQIAAKRGVGYDVVAAEMAQRDLDALMNA